MNDDSLLNIEIDGRALKARKGAMIIEVADAAGITIPRFCYHPRLSVAANCRMCLVEVEKAPKPLPAGATPVMDGMKVHTRSPAALHSQKAVMEFLLINHPLDCPICDQGGECELQDLAMGYGRDVSRFAERKRVVADPDIGPLIATEMTRCIHCTRCVRFGEEIGGVPELGATGRGENTRIGTFIARSVDSELSGNVIDLCPVGALTSRPFRFRARAWEMQQVAAISPHDPIGSNLDLHVRRGRVLRVVPGHNDAINEVWLADRDRFSYEALYSEERLTAPRIKRDGEWVEVDWESAIEETCNRLRTVLAEQGPQALGALASASATTEELYLLQKLLRGLGSNNVDHRLRQLDTSDDPAAAEYPALGVRIAEIEQADAVLLVGSNTRKEHPLVNLRLRKAALRGAAVMAIGYSDHGFNYPLAGMLSVAPSALPGVLASLAAGPDGAADDAARAITERLTAAERPLVLLGPGVLDHPDAARLRALAAVVADRAGARLGVLATGANAAGGWLAGALPHRGPLARAVAEPGRAAMQMLDGSLAGVLLLGVEPELDCADGPRGVCALEAASTVISLSAFCSPAMERYADIQLPIAAFGETHGRYVNMEGQWQSFAAGANPAGEARPGWRGRRCL